MSDLRFEAVSTDGFPADEVHSSKDTRLAPNLADGEMSGISVVSEFPAPLGCCFSDTDLACDNPPRELGLFVYNL
jgi:hypothetical protein